MSRFLWKIFLSGAVLITDEAIKVEPPKIQTLNVDTHKENTPDSNTSKEQAHNKRASRDQSLEINVIKDQDKKDRSSKDKSKKNLDTKDRSSQDRALKDKSKKDRDRKDRSSEDRTFKDISKKDRDTEDRSSQDRPLKDKSKKDRDRKDRSSQDRALKDKSKKDRGMEDRSSQDRTLKDKSKKDRDRKDRSSEDRTFKDISKKDRDRKDRSSQDRALKEKSKKDHDKKDRSSEDRTFKDKSKKDRDRKDRSSQDRALKDKSKKDLDRKERSSQDRTSKDKSKKDRDRKDRPSQDRALKDKSKKDRDTVDHSSQDRTLKDKSNKDLDRKNRSSEDRTFKDKSKKDLDTEDRSSQDRALKKRGSMEYADKDYSSKDYAGKEYASLEYGLVGRDHTPVDDVFENIQRKKDKVENTESEKETVFGVDVTHTLESEQYTPVIMTNFEALIITLLAGGLSGAVAKTLVAPMDFSKREYFVHHSDEPYSLRAGIRFIEETYKLKGIAIFYKAGMFSMIRAIPFAAIQFAAHLKWKENFKITPESPPYIRIFAGSLSGATALIIVYPFDLVLAQMYLFEHDDINTLFKAFRYVWAQGGILGLYRGFFPSLLGVIPYGGISFYTYDALKHRFIDPTHKNPSLYFGLCGAVAGLLGQTASYPLEIVRRHMQLATPLDSRYKTFTGTVLAIWRTQGFQGFYEGLSINWIKGPIAVGASFATFDTIMEAFKLNDMYE